MLDLIVNAIAVPFGYTSELNESQGTYFRDPLTCASGMWTQDTGNPSGWSLLPDVVQSNTPPPSPLRRALSSSIFVFPEETKSRTSGVARPKTEIEKEKGKDHLKISHDSSFPISNSNPDGEGEETANRHRQDIQELNWKLPHHRKSPPDLCQEAIRKENQMERDGVADKTDIPRLLVQCQAVGCDIRKIADQFESDHAKIKSKSKEEDSTVAVPEIFTKCVSVSVLFLIWWRLFNRLR